MGLQELQIAEFKEAFDEFDKVNETILSIFRVKLDNTHGNHGMVNDRIEGY